MIPRDKLQVLSDYEKTLKKVLLKLICKFYKQEVGKDIPSAYYEAFKEHGLVLSSYKSEKHATRCGNRHGKVGDLLEVHDGRYLAKTMGYDLSGIFGGDSEMTASNSKSNLNGNSTGTPRIGGKIPFDLLCEKLTAGNVDLWCEYAIATKGIPCFTFSKGLEKSVNEYYKAPPNEESVSLSFKSQSVNIGSFTIDDYKKLYRSFQVGNMLEMAKYGVDKLAEWAKTTFDIDILRPDTENLSSGVKKLSIPTIPLDSFENAVKEENLPVPNESPVKEKIQVNEEDLAVAEKMDGDIYNAYHLRIVPLVTNGISVEDAIHSLNLADYQKDLLLSLAIHHRENIRKSKAQLENLNSGSDSIFSSPPSDIEDFVQYERLAERELKKQEAYQAIANATNISKEDKDKLFRLLDEYHSSHSS